MTYMKDITSSHPMHMTYRCHDRMCHIYARVLVYMWDKHDIFSEELVGVDLIKIAVIKLLERDWIPYHLR